MNLAVTLDVINAGGPGSGCNPDAGKCGRPDGSGGKYGTDTTERRERAREAYNGVDKEKWAIAHQSELSLAAAIGGERVANNAPFDVVKGKTAFEVKTIVGGKNDKITMHPDSRRRKLREVRRKGYKQVFTVVIDARKTPPRVYMAKGLGSFRLRNMQQMGSLRELARKLK